MGPVSAPVLPTTAEILAAVSLVTPRVRRTPLLRVEVGGRAVDLKLELLQHSGSFKVRGAFHSVLAAEPTPSALVAASGGNHGLAVAHVGHRLDLPTRIFVPESAPAVKVDAIAALGATVDRVGATYADALAASLEASREPGVLALHAYDSPGTVTGQATLGVELAEDLPEVDTVLVATGGGGLYAGVTLGLDAVRPGARVVPVEPADCPTLQAALEAGSPVRVEVGGVAADALGASTAGVIAFATAREHRALGVLVEDAEILEARRWLWREARVAAEPAGAAALAALLSGRYRPAAGESVCVVVCGGNADPSGL